MSFFQTGKYLILTNVSASDRGVYVCFAAVTPRKSITNSQHNTNDVLLSDNDEDQIVQPKESEDEIVRTNEEGKKNETGIHVEDEEPLVENNNEKPKNASTTSMLPMPNDAISSNVSLSSTSASRTASMPASSSFSPATASDSASTAISNKTAPATSDRPRDTITNTTTASSSSSSSSNITSSTSYSSSSSSSSDNDSLTTIQQSTTSISLQPHADQEEELLTAEEDDDVVQEFQAFQKINLTVRTPPGPVSQLYFKASTILGFLVWRFNKTNSGGYPVRSFTAEFRNVSYDTQPYNSSFEHQWSRMDPINIAPNVVSEYYTFISVGIRVQLNISIELSNNSELFLRPGTTVRMIIQITHTPH